MRSGGQPVDQLNELECVGPHVYANIWMTDRIVRIDPKSGEVRALIDAGEPAARRPSAIGVDVLNGIAHDSEATTRSDHREALAAHVPRALCSVSTRRATVLRRGTGDWVIGSVIRARVQTKGPAGEPTGPRAF